MTTPAISRRTVLQGLGVSLALPLLEGMSFAAPAKTPPRRMAFIYVPNGIHMEDWTPAEEGALKKLTPTLEPLTAFKDDLLVLTGLTADKARPNGDGPGDHARAMSAFLTGSQPRKTAGANIKVGISADQFAAQQIGAATKFPTLEIGCEGGRTAGNCDSGYSCAYSSSISWRTESSPVAKETNPRLVFERLFGGGKGSDRNSYKAAAYKKSLLDFVAEDARSLRGRLGSADTRKLDEYLDGVREIERRLAKFDQPTEPTTAPAGATAPTGFPKASSEHLRLLGDMMVLAFQADLTRICTFVFANEGSNRPYREIGISEGHHDLSHHGRKKEKQDKIQKINKFHIEALAYIIGKLKSVKEGDKSLLDSSMIAYGSGNSDGNRHNHDNLPILLLGKGGGSLKTGRHIRYAQNTPVANLWIEMMERMTVKVDRFGDSNGRLTGLSE
ncbi:MAG: DUF1552 domain-containing protein [Planctomycetia bacterium]|nr:DUF1552 domain-containing protein [Planctomycetia bacterium]